MQEFITNSYEMIVEHNITMLKECWNTSSDDFLKKRGEFQNIKVTCTKLLQPRMGHPAQTQSLQNLIDTALEKSHDSLVNIEKFSESTRKKIELITIDFIQHLQFLTIQSVELFNNMNRKDAPLTFDPISLPSLEVDQYPFQSVRDRFKDMFVKALYDLAYFKSIVSSRDEGSKIFLDLLLNRLQSLNNFLSQELASENKWKADFMENVQFVKSAFKK
jgi:hypothetical protein